MKVLLAIDESANARAALESLVKRSYPADTEVRVVAVYDPHQSLLGPHHLSERKARDICKEVQESTSQCQFATALKCEALPGSPSEVIMQIMADWHPDKIFLGARSQRKWLDAFQESVANALFRKIKCGLVIARADDKGKFRPEKRQLICMDHSSVSDKVVAAVEQRELSPDAELMLLNVVEPPTDVYSENPHADAKHTAEHLHEMTESSRKMLDERISLMSKRFPGNAITSNIVTDVGIVEVILEAARKWEADLIVTGSHLREGMDKFWLGSVSEAVWRQAPCSVEIIR